MKPPTLQHELPALWDDLSLRPYLSEVSRRHGVVDALALPNMRDLPPIRVERLYVHPRLSTEAVSPATAPENWPEGESLFAALQSTPSLVLLGDPGSGKTTLTNWLAWRLASGLVTSLPSALEGRVPVPCVLREMPASAFSPNVEVADLAVLVAERLLGDKADMATRASLRARVEAKNYVLILDGIDEIKVAHRQVVAAWIRKAADDGACVIATARIVGYEDYPVDRPYVPPPPSSAEPALTGEQLLQLGAPSCADENAAVHAGRWAQIRFLMPFDQKRVASFVENWYLQRSGSEHEAGQKARDFLEALNQSVFLQELARTPNLLSLMAIVFRERAYLPDGKALLYKEIANAYINTIDRHRKIDDDGLAPYTWEAREGWLAFVGFRMQLERGATNDELTDSGLLVSEEKVLEWLAEAMAASNVVGAKDRARDFLSWIARRSGLLLPRGEGRYAFVHLSFQEYFCARYLAGRIMSPAFIKNRQTDDAPVTKEKLSQWSERKLWHETFVYLLELISGERDSDWVEDLLEILFDFTTNDLSDGHAHLFARILTNRHIHVSPKSKSALASRCVQAAMSEWLGPDPSVLAALARANHAAIIVTEPRRWQNRFKDLPTREFQTLHKTDSNEDLYILIAHHAPREVMREAARFKKLQSLDLSYSNVADISKIASLKSLRTINLTHTEVKNLEPLTGLDRLSQVNLTATKVTDVLSLSRIPSLKRLNLSATRVQDITPLESLKNLEVLDLSETSVIDISPLRNLKKLFLLKLDGTSIADISVLSKLESLFFLSIKNTPVSDLSALKDLKDLRYLVIEGMEGLDVSILSGLVRLHIFR
jgi:hypothetical protein